MVNDIIYKGIFYYNSLQEIYFRTVIARNEAISHDEENRHHWREIATSREGAGLAMTFFMNILFLLENTIIE